MIIKNLFKFLFALTLTALFIFGCASPRMANIPSTAEPRVEIGKLATDLNQAVLKNIDVLAASEFKKSRSTLTQAEIDLKNGKPQNEVLDSVRIARGYLVDAYSKSGNKESQAEGLFAARQTALRAGAGSIIELRNDFSDLDSKVSDRSEKLAETKSETLSEYQKQYIDLERRAVISTQLGQTQARVTGAENDKAKQLAPISLKAAQLSLKTAESIISTNVRNPEGYKAAVLKAKLDTMQLSNVMTTIAQNGKNLAESVAIKMVSQNKAISGLESDLMNSEAKGEANQTAMQLENDKLSSTNDANAKKLNNANYKVQIQRALEKARSQFSKSEADAYQQGENLVIRLKQINFSSGKSDLPASSLPSLAKVLDVAKSLNTSHITVEGHTDSVGGEVENKTISESRASSVATYFKSNGLSDVEIQSEGYGYSKPLTTNKTKEGRAQNRRVDIILSPKTLTQ